MVEAMDNPTGNIVETMHLVVRLEQLTYTEQLTRQTYEAYKIITEGE